jgi:hypothetical protein
VADGHTAQLPPEFAEKATFGHVWMCRTALPGVAVPLDASARD